MIARFHKKFDKAFVKLPLKVKKQAINRIELFADDPSAQTLRKHALNTPYKGSFSIDITGDYRAIFYLVEPDVALFTHIGTHAQLYGKKNKR